MAFKFEISFFNKNNDLVSRDYIPWEIRIFHRIYKEIHSMDSQFEPNQELSLPPTPFHVRLMMSLKFGVLKKLLIVWIITIVIALGVLISMQILHFKPAEPIVVLWGGSFFLIALFALVCEYIDSTLGMGYGTTLTPVLLLMGFEPLTVVPAILISELITGISGAISHKEAGNIDLSPKSMHFKIAMVLGLCSMVGAVIAVAIAVNISKEMLSLFIGIIVTAVGIVLIATRGRQFPFSWRKIFALGLVASFNKALSGGGYGPLVMGGQLVSGVEGKPAIGITSLAEGLTCLVGVILFALAGKITDLSLALALVVGAVCSIPFCAYTVRKVQQNYLVQAIAILTIILGSWTLFRALL